MWRVRRHQLEHDGRVSGSFADESVDAVNEAIYEAQSENSQLSLFEAVGKVHNDDIGQKRLSYGIAKLQISESKVSLHEVGPKWKK